MAKESRTAKPETFEDLYTRLEANVTRLEQGGLSLDDAIALYEAGMTLARACQDRLDDAEQRITKLKESFAPVARGNGVILNDAPVEDDIEYVSEDEGFEESEGLP